MINQMDEDNNIIKETTNQILKMICEAQSFKTRRSLSELSSIIIDLLCFMMNYARLYGKDNQYQTCGNCQKLQWDINHMYCHICISGQRFLSGTETINKVVTVNPWDRCHAIKLYGKNAWQINEKIIEARTGLLA